jgi:hypothetical protein
MLASIRDLCESERTEILINYVSDPKESLSRVGFSFGFTSPDKNVKGESIGGRPVAATGRLGQNWNEW